MDSEPRFVIAVFDEWKNLNAALEDLKAHGISPQGAVLFARDDGPEGPQTSSVEVISFLLAETTELPFLTATRRVRCTSGVLARALAARSRRGARRLAGALKAWVSWEHADALQRHIEKGRLVLWFELAQPEDLGIVCGRLVQTSPHVVGTCNMASRL
jgi:hypothetical protein